MCQHVNKDFGIWNLADGYRWREFKCQDCGAVGGQGVWTEDEFMKPTGEVKCQEDI